MFSTRLVATAIGFIAIGVLGTASAQAQEVCIVTSPEENVALVQAYEQAFDEADFESIDLVLHDEYVDTMNRHALSEDIDETTNEDEHALAMMMEQLYPGSEVFVDEIIAFGPYVVAITRTVVTQHALTPDGAVAQLETPAVMPGIAVFRIECGQIVHGHIVHDGFLLMLGLGFTFVPAM